MESQHIYGRVAGGHGGRGFCMCQKTQEREAVKSAV